MIKLDFYKIASWYCIGFFLSACTQSALNAQTIDCDGDETCLETEEAITDFAKRVFDEEGRVYKLKTDQLEYTFNNSPRGIDYDSYADLIADVFGYTGGVRINQISPARAEQATSPLLHINIVDFVDEEKIIKDLEPKNYKIEKLIHNNNLSCLLVSERSDYNDYETFVFIHNENNDSKGTVSIGSESLCFDLTFYYHLGLLNIFSFFSDDEIKAHDNGEERYKSNYALYLMYRSEVLGGDTIHEAPPRIRDFIHSINELRGKQQ